MRFQQLAPFAYHLALRLQAGQPHLEAQLDLAEVSGLDAADLERVRGWLDKQ